MKIKRTKSSWKRNLIVGTCAVLGLLAIYRIIVGPNDGYEQLTAEYDQYYTEVNRVIRKTPAVPSDYDKIGRSEADELADAIRRLRDDMRAEHEAVQDAYRHAEPYFARRARMAEKAEETTLRAEQEQVNNYLSELEEKIKTCREQVQSLNDAFCQEGVSQLNAWHDPQQSSARPYMSKAEYEVYKALKKYANEKYNGVLDEFKSRCLAPDTERCNELAEQVEFLVDQSIKPKIKRMERQCEYRRAFYNSNVENEHATGASNFDAGLNDKLVFKAIASPAPRGAYNLCSKPHAAMQELEAFLATLPGSLAALNGELLPAGDTPRPLQVENADFRFAVTADIDESLLRPLLKDWLKGKGSPFDGSKVTFYEPKDSPEWLIVQQVPGASSKRKDLFRDEFWIHIKTLAATEKAEDILGSSAPQQDLLITGDTIPSALMESRRYDINAMNRLCSDAVIFVDNSKGGKESMVLDIPQVLGKAEGKKKLTRIFFPEGSAQRRISDIFSLAPASGDKVLGSSEKAAIKEAIKTTKDGALIVPWHRCDPGLRVYALALPDIETTGKSKKIIAERGEYGRPANAACPPCSDSIRSQEYSLSYHINIFRLQDSEFAKNFRAYCSGADGQACVQRRNYVTLRASNSTEFRVLTADDLPVKPVIQRLKSAGNSLGYGDTDSKLFGLKLSNVAFFETDQTDPTEASVKVDASDEKSLADTMEYLLKKGTISTNFAVVVIGHADARGSADHNMNLSARRGMSAAQKMLYNVPGGEKLRGGTPGKDAILYYNKEEGLSLVTLGCSIWRPLTDNKTRETALALAAKGGKDSQARAKANDLLRPDRRVEFFIIIPKPAENTAED